jgi:hypothetical protein
METKTLDDKEKLTKKRKRTLKKDFRQAHAPGKKKQADETWLRFRTGKDPCLAAVAISVNCVATGLVTGLLDGADRFLQLAKTLFIAGGQNLAEHLGDVLE